MFKDFKAFAMKGNVIDLAVGVIIGAAFGKIVNSLVADILMPPLGLLLGNVDFSSLFLSLNGQPFASLAAAKAAGAPTLNYGLFLNAVIEFLIVAVSVFILIRQVSRFTAPRPAPAAALASRDCPWCATPVPLAARRCPHCTSEIAKA